MARRQQEGHAALRREIETRRELVCGFARRWLRDDHDAEDATQEIMIRLLRDCDQLRAADRLEPWIYRVATNTLINFKRKARRIEALESAAPPPRVPELDAARLASEREQRALVSRSVAELPTSLRAVVILKYYQALNQTEISEVLQRPRSTVQSQLKKGLERLKAQLTASGASAVVPELERLLLDAPPSPSAAVSPLVKKPLIASSLAAVAGGLALKLKVTAVAGVTILAGASLGLVLLAPSTERPRPQPIAKTAAAPQTRSEAPAAIALQPKTAPTPAAMPGSAPTKQDAEPERVTVPPPPGWHDPELGFGLLLTVVDESGVAVDGAQLSSSGGPSFYPASARHTPAPPLAVSETDAAGQIYLAVSRSDFAQSFELFKEGYIGRLEGEERLLSPSQYISISLLSRELPEELTITLIKGCAIRGEVYAPGGQPIDAVIKLYRTASEEVESRGIVNSIRAKDGSFTFSALVPGTYELIAKHPDHIHARRTVTVDALEAALALRLQLGRGGSVAGRITDERGQPIAGAELVVRPAGGRALNPLGSYQPRAMATSDRELSERSGRSDERGAFRISGLAPEEVDVYVLASGYETAVRREVAVGQSDLDFRLTAGGVIAGQVLSPQGDPIPGGKVWIKGEGLRQGMKSVGIDDEGRFRAEKLFAGRYLLWVMPEGFGQHTLRNIAAGTTKLKVVVSPRLVIRGRVVQSGAEPIRELAIRAFTDHGGSTVEAVRPEADGRFEVSLAVSPPLRKLSFFTFSHAPIVLENVRAPGGALEGLELRFKEGCRVSGRVIDADGAPVRRASISISTFPYVGQTKEDGSFGFNGLPHGRQTISVSPVGGESVEVEVNLLPEEKREGFDIVLPKRR